MRLGILGGAVWVTIIGVKTLHEFGHATTCRHFGGEVHEMGVCLMCFTPAGYVDASDAWISWVRVEDGGRGERRRGPHCRDGSKPQMVFHEDLAAAVLGVSSSGSAR